MTRPASCQCVEKVNILWERLEGPQDEEANVQIFRRPSRAAAFSVDKCPKSYYTKSYDFGHLNDKRGKSGCIRTGLRGYAGSTI